ncbi:MAG TPA: hypothetical protein VGJ15_03195 [Pirellulales bacterium]|jgi:hypothetical protein
MQSFKKLIEKGALSYTAIYLHLPRFIDEDNVEEMLALVPGQWKENFYSEIIAFDPNQIWDNSDYPVGLPPPEYSRGMAILREYITRIKPNEPN